MDNIPASFTRRYMKLLGVHSDYRLGDVIIVRGSKYVFPSFTDVFRASRGHLSEYQADQQT